MKSWKGVVKTRVRAVKTRLRAVKTRNGAVATRLPRNFFCKVAIFSVKVLWLLDHAWGGPGLGHALPALLPAARALPPGALRWSQGRSSCLA